MCGSIGGCVVLDGAVRQLLVRLIYAEFTRLNPIASGDIDPRQTGRAGESFDVELHLRFGLPGVAARR